jgi:hypothetical protein
MKLLPTDRGNLGLKKTRTSKSKTISLKSLIFSSSRSFGINPQYQVTVGKKGGEPILLLISLDQIASHRLAMGMEKYPIGECRLNCLLS